MNRDFPTIGEFLRELIGERGDSQVRIAEALDVDKPQFNKWLSGKAPIPPQYLPEIQRVLHLSDRESKKLTALHGAHESKKTLLSLSRSKTFKQYQRDYSAIGNYLIAAAARLSELDHRESPDELPEALFSHHLIVAAGVLKSVQKALRPNAELVFHAQNVRFHVQYPANYYAAALMTLSDAQDGAELGRSLQHLVDDVLETGPSRDGRFLPDLAHQHAIHMNARAGDSRSRFAGQLRPARRGTADVHDERMFIVGRAHRPDPQESDWTALLDALQRPDFQAAVLAFDASHYDGDPVQTDGWRPNPAIVRKTALKYLSSILSPDVHQRLYAALRLRALAESVPKLLRDPALDLRVRIIDERGGADIPKEAHAPLLVIRTINKKEEK